MEKETENIWDTAVKQGKAQAEAWRLQAEEYKRSTAGGKTAGAAKPETTTPDPAATFTAGKAERPVSDFTEDELEKLLLQRSKEKRRQRLIREVQHGEPTPYSEATARSKRLREMMARTKGDEIGLEDQIAVLNAMFRDMVLHTPRGEGMFDVMDEKSGYLIALRAQQQAMRTAEALARLEKIRQGTDEKS